MKAQGRPSKYTENLADQICERVATTTLSSTAIAKEFHLAEDTIYLWRWRYPSFSEKYARAKEKQQDRIVEQILSQAQDSKSDNMVKVNRDRLIVDTHKWVMSKLAPKTYADRTVQDVNVTEISGELDAARKRAKAFDNKRLAIVPKRKS